MSQATTTYLPPRQPHQPVQRIAKWALILISTVVCTFALYLFFRGTQPRRVTFATSTPAAHISPMADGWMQGLPDQPVAVEPPPKPQPPIDEQARRDVQRLQEQLRDRDAQLNKSLDEIRKMLAQQKPTQQKAPPKPDPMAEMRQKAMLSPMQVVEVKLPKDEPGAHLGMMLLPAGTYLPIILETAINSDREGKAVARVLTPILDPSGRVVIPQQATLVGSYRSADLLYGDERLDLWFSQLNLGQSVSLTLEDGGVADGMGQAGVAGDVDQHYWRLLGAMFINGVLKGGAMAMTQEVAGLGPAGQVTSGIVNSGAAVGQQRTLRTMNTRPTIRVPLGYRMTLILGKDLGVKPISS